MPEKYKRRIKQSKGNAAQQMNKNVPFLNIENANKTQANDTVFGYKFVDLKETLTSNQIQALREIDKNSILENIQDNYSIQGTKD